MARSHHHVKHGGLSTSINSVIGKKPANPEQPSKASGMHHLFIRRVVASSEIQERITEMWGGIIPIAPRGLDSLDVTPFNELHSIALPTNTTAMVMKKLVRRYAQKRR